MFSQTQHKVYIINLMYYTYTTYKTLYTEEFVLFL